MNHTIEEAPIQQNQAEKPLLFVVWVDLYMGFREMGEDWVMNSEHCPPTAKPLSEALDEAAEGRSKGFPVKVLPEGMTPGEGT